MSETVTPSVRETVPAPAGGTDLSSVWHLLRDAPVGADDCWSTDGWAAAVTAGSQHLSALCGGQPVTGSLLPAHARDRLPVGIQQLADSRQQPRAVLMLLLASAARGGRPPLADQRLLAALVERQHLAGLLHRSVDALPDSAAAGAGRLLLAGDLLLADSVSMNDGVLTQDAGKDWEFVGPDYVDERYFGVGAGIAVRVR